MDRMPLDFRATFLILRSAVVAESLAALVRDMSDDLQPMLPWTRLTNFISLCMKSVMIARVSGIMLFSFLGSEIGVCLCMVTSPERLVSSEQMAWLSSYPRY